MRNLKQFKQTHWAYWASGALLSLASLGATPMYIPQYGAMGIVSLLFIWGNVSNEREQIRATPNS